MLVFVASLFIQIFSLAQPLIIQQIIDKVIGQQNFNTLYFLGVLLIGCSIISNILNLIRTFCLPTPLTVLILLHLAIS